jgi:hypothetical protein
LIRKVAAQDAQILSMQTRNTLRFGERKDAITRFDLVRRRLLAVWDTDARQVSDEMPDREIIIKL